MRAVTMAFMLCAALCVCVYSSRENTALASSSTVTDAGLYLAIHRLGDVGKPNQPKLSSAQREWCDTVLANSYWKSRLANLWYANNQITDPSNKVLPLIIFYVPKTYLEHGLPDNETTYYIVGNGCGSLFIADKRFAPTVPALIAQSGRVWPPGCYYDPLAAHQRDVRMNPPLPPRAPY